MTNVEPVVALADPPRGELLGEPGVGDARGRRERQAFVASSREGMAAV